MKEPIFEILLKSLMRIRVLRFFLNHSEISYTKEELKKRLKISQSLLDKEIKDLKKISFLKAAGRKITLNNDFPLMESLKNFVLRPAPDLYENLKKELKPLRGIKLFLNCGFFEGEDNSLIDFLIVGDKTKLSAIKNKINQLELQFGRELKYAFFAVAEFNYRYSMFDKFLRDILEKPHKTIINRFKNFRWI